MKKSSVLKMLKDNVLTLATMAGVISGVILGICLKTREAPWTPREVLYVSFVGDLFLSMLKSVIIPLIIPSLIASVGSLDLRLSGKVGGRAVVYYMSTTVIAVILGIILVTTIQPGVGNDVDEKEAPESSSRTVLTSDTLMDLIRNCFPPNIVQATVQQYKTTLIEPDFDGVKLMDFGLVNSSDPHTWEVTGKWSDNTNILGLVVFSIVTGIAIAICGEAGEPLLHFFTSVSIVMMKVTTWIIYFAPIGVCSLIAGQIIEMADFADTFGRLGWYFGTVLVGLIVHGGIILPILFTVITRTLPFQFIFNMGNALTTAFGTASSSATLPVTIESLEEKNHVHPKIARFVLPIGATINMDGTALYEAIAAIFIAQLRGVSLSIGSVVAISITATAASIGAAGIPQAGLVTMVMVLDTVGLPSKDASLIFAVDWLLDRFRTTINVLGDAIGAGIVYHLSKKEIEDMEKAELEEQSNMNSSTSKGSTNKGFENTSM